MKTKEPHNRARAISELLGEEINSRAGLMSAKRKLAKRYGIGILGNAEILQEYQRRLLARAVKRSPALEKTLRKRTVRTMSGVAPVAVLTKAYPCPGRCAYCPTEKNMPQSYLSNEPAVMRAVRCDFNPYWQVQDRLAALEANGHKPEKIELIVIGGTWSVLPAAYKYWYIWQCFKAANEYGGKIPNSKSQIPNKFQIPNSKQIQNTKYKIQEFRQKLLREQKKNESAKYRIIGITLETRPDYINEGELWQMRELGCTRVEIGVQAIDDKILKLNRRGHGVLAIAAATKMLKDYGFKVTYHLMPGLPGSSARKDLAMFKKLFTDQRFQPDQIKFYPTVVTRGSLLYRWWRAGKYRPYSDKALQNLIVECKKAVPPYVRIIRLIRDIPKESIVAGNKITNLRQIMKDRGAACRCIRCREAGGKQLSIKNYLPTGQAGELRIIKYHASDGLEFFIQATDKSGGVLYGFCRLRLISHSSIKNAALIRELHVYGELVPVGAETRRGASVQHAGLGKMLMKKAEAIAKENGYKKIAVISGIGVRGYYRKLGYKLQHSYMVKNLV
ncbi:MAG: tRNA uridine(34) 5-carboxymethylaminomethyl modification radical SAM/GNAT enzyme Elp3 [Patescibacteria group bacterium]|nr:tRNA uridine(34) 5-carboxymethylaminomethyl modification radical SAM/GNAT enzyme Elp3 [Patescibacteria group bacterium]